jgi:hypothetical protein
MRLAILAVAAGSVLAIGACAPGVGVAAAARTPAAASRWQKAEQVPGLAALAGYSDDSTLAAISCASAGNCAAGGWYATLSGSEPFVVSQADGTWGKALEVPGIAAVNRARGQAAVTSVSCTAPGDCTAGGYYTDKIVPQDVRVTMAFVVSEVNGAWGTAQQVPGIARLRTGFGAQVSSVSCASPGNCAAGGSFEISSGGPGCCRSLGFVASEVSGAWSKARPVAGTAGIGAVSCTAPGGCGAVGKIVLSETGGAWGAPHAVAAPPGSTFGTPSIGVLSCAAPGECGAGGGGLKMNRALLVSQVHGTWGTVAEIAGTATLIKGGRSVIASLSCAAPGNCTGGGYAPRSVEEGSSTGEFAVPYVVIERKGTWGHAVLIPAMGTLSKNGYAVITSVSCATPSDCAVGGEYATSSYNPDGSGPGQAFVVSKVNGTWTTPLDITSALHNLGPTGITVACPAAGECSGAGAYSTGSQQWAFVVSQVR